MEHAMRNGRRAAPRRLLGFTFVELMVVLVVEVDVVGTQIDAAGWAIAKK